MDPVTHALLGASTGITFFGRKLGKSSAAIGALAGFIPDADIFIRSATDPLLALEFHRHFTHGLAFAPLGGLIVGSLWLFSKDCRKKFVMVWLCATAGYVSHCLLDSATTYGTQLFWPFSNARVGWDWIAIVDPIATAFLFTGVVMMFRRQSLKAPVIGLLAFLLYVAFGIFQHTRAMNVQRDLSQKRGHALERGEAMPTIGNNVVWRSLYLSNGRIYSDRIRVPWVGKAAAWEGTDLPLATPESLSPSEQAINNQTKAFQRFSWFSSGWIARAPDHPSILGDMRYSLKTSAFDPIWGIRFLTNSSQPPYYEWVNRSRERRIHPRELWDEIMGQNPL